MAGDGPTAARLIERLVLPIETLSKEAIFDCRMGGRCILHETGQSCPMRRPENERNGPCSGVRSNGHCEVYPKMAYLQEEAVAEIIHRAGLLPHISPATIQVRKSTPYVPVTR